jgi:hypothetical protein
MALTWLGWGASLCRSTYAAYDQYVHSNMIGVPSFDKAVPAAATLRDVVGGVYEAQMGRALAWERYARSQ